MKKLLFCATLFALCTINTMGQLEQGTLFMSGSTNMNFSSVNISSKSYDSDWSDSDNYSQQKFYYQLGYFAFDNITLGLSYTYLSTDYQSEYTKYQLIGPFAQYYMGIRNIKPFIQANLGMGSEDYDKSTTAYDYDILAWDLGGGVAVFFNDYIALNFVLSYTNITATDPDDDDNTAKGIIQGINFNGGISIYL